MASQLTPPTGGPALKGRLAGPGDATEPAAAPDQRFDAQRITDFLKDLRRLSGVPFGYLVPDIGMLPVESIRFFQVDPNWIEALVDGAFSVGSLPGVDGAEAQAGARLKASSGEGLTGSRDAMMGKPAPAAGDGKPGLKTSSGFLLRSAVVSGWPGLEVAGFADADGRQPLSILRMERPAPSLLLCLFEGTIRRVDLHEPTEGLHFGTQAPPNVLSKTLRYAVSGNGVQAGDPIPGSTVSVPVRAAGGGTVLRANALATALAGRVFPPGTPPAQQIFTSAQFALELVQGATTVSFRDSTS